VKTYGKALERERNHLGATRRLAALHVREGRTEQAVKLLASAAAAHPTSSVPLADLALVHERAGRVPAAVAAYREALRRTPDDTLVENNLANLLGRNRATLDEAVALAERAHRRVPGSPSAMDTLGWLVFLQGDIGRGGPLVEQAARAAPANPQILYHLGVIYERQGKRSEAQRVLARALSGTAFPEADEARRLLDKIR
jgi:Flp pilus assembly protein TadD